MYTFFYRLYLALFSGTWNPNAQPDITAYINRVASLIINTFGGHFETIQEFELFGAGLTPYGIFANILAVITMFGVCFGVLKLTKAVFSIFFGGR